MDVLLGADYYGEILLRGRRNGPRGTPYALRMCFGWVLAGPLQSKDSRPAAYTCCTITEDDDILRKFWEIEDYNMKRPALSPEEKTVAQYFEAMYSRMTTVGLLFHFHEKWELNRSGVKDSSRKEIYSA